MKKSCRTIASLKLLSIAVSRVAVSFVAAGNQLQWVSRRWYCICSIYICVYVYMYIYIYIYIFTGTKNISAVKKICLGKCQKYMHVFSCEYIYICILYICVCDRAIFFVISSFSVVAFRF